MLSCFCLLLACRICRELMLNSVNVGVLAALFTWGAVPRPNTLGIQDYGGGVKTLGLCPPSPNCISTAEEANDPDHYVPAWSYNPEDGRGRKNPASKEQVGETGLQHYPPLALCHTTWRILAPWRKLFGGEGWEKGPSAQSAMHCVQSVGLVSEFRHHLLCLQWSSYLAVCSLQGCDILAVTFICVKMFVVTPSCCPCCCGSCCR